MMFFLLQKKHQDLVAIEIMFAGNYLSIGGRAMSTEVSPDKIRGGSFPPNLNSTEECFS